MKKFEKAKRAISIPEDVQTSIVRGVVFSSLLLLIAFLVVTVEGKFWLGQLIGPILFVSGYVLVSCCVAIVCYWVSGLKNRLFIAILVCAPITIRLLEAAYGWSLAILNYCLVLLIVSFISCALTVHRFGFKARAGYFFGAFVIALITMTGNLELRQPPALNSYVKNYQPVVSQLALEDPSKAGNVKYTTFTYGSGKDLHRPEFAEKVDIVTSSVDGTSLLESWRGVSDTLRRYFFGFTAAELPVQGRVWLPDTMHKTPLVLMVHGNHAMEKWSDKGYQYLGEHLASKGYTFVSVDQNFLNGTNAEGFFGFGRFRLYGENDARAFLLLKHLQQWREWQEDKTSPLYNKIDLNHIVLMGHSRGGEGAYTAAAFNKMKYYPDEASLEFDFNFNIKGVVSIAPSDTQYQPRGSLTQVDDISYLTMQGTADGDATVFMGASAYSRVEFTNNGANNDRHFKSSIMIQGANHSQFNSEWGGCDKIPYRCWLAKYFNSTIPAAEQQNLTKLFITAFMETVTKKDDAYLPLFQNAALVSSWGYHNQITANYLDSSAVILADYEDDADLSTGQRGSINGNNLSHWSEAKLKHHANWSWTNLSTHAVELEWGPGKKQSSYVVNFSPMTARDKCFGFSLANINTGGDVLTVDSGQIVTNFSIRIRDESGEHSKVELTDFYKLYPALIRKPDLYEDPVNEPTFQSVKIPYSAFKHTNSNLSQNIESMAFVFDKTPTGRIYIDDVYLADCG